MTARTCYPGIAMSFLAAFGLIFIIGCGSGKEGPVAELKSPTGAVQSKVSPSAAFIPAKEGDALSIGGAVRTEENSEVRLVFSGKGEVAIKPVSYFEVTSGELLGRQSNGTAIYKIQKQKENIKIETPQGVTAVLGTTFLLKIDKGLTTMVVVEEGKVAFTNKQGNSVEVNPGEQLIAKAEGALPAPIKIDPITREQLFKGKSGPALNQR